MSTRPSGNAASRTVSSVISVGNFAAFLYHETQIAPFCVIVFRHSASHRKSSSRLLIKCLTAQQLDPCPTVPEVSHTPVGQSNYCDDSGYGHILALSHEFQKNAPHVCH